MLNKKKSVKLTTEEENNLKILKSMFKKKNKTKDNDKIEIKDPKAVEVLSKVKEDIVSGLKKFVKWFNKCGIEIILLTLMIFSLINVSVHLGGTKFFKDYDDYKQYEISQNYTFEFKDSYYVYIYSNNCSACSSIKRDIFQYLESPKNDRNNGIKMYLLCADNFDNTGANGTLVGVSDPDNIKVKSVPYLLFVDGENNKVLNEWTTTSAITSQLKIT